MLPKGFEEKMELLNAMQNAVSNSFVVNHRTGQKEMMQNAVAPLCTIAAADYYEPIISERDKEIQQLKSKISAAEQVQKEENQAAIELLAEKYQQLADLMTENNRKSAEIAELQSKYDKVLGLLKNATTEGLFASKLDGEAVYSEAEDRQWEIFCKQHNI